MEEMMANKDSLQKSLSKLQDLAKGQLFHAPSDSAPGTWAGTTPEDVNENESAIDSNGTDYQGVRKSLAAKVRKSLALTQAEVAIAEGRNPMQAIGAKLAKSEKLTPAEQWAVKGGWDDEKKMFKSGEGPKDEPSHAAGESKDAGSVPDSSPAGDDTEVEGDAKKSLAASDELQKGFDVSPFLADFAGAMAQALSEATATITKSVAAKIDGLRAELTKSIQDQDQFNKSLAEATVGIGTLMQGQAKAATAAAQAPVGAPRSQLRAVSGGQDLSKSIGPGGMHMDLNKSQIVDAMVDLVKSNKLPANEVVKFESTGQLPDGIKQLVQQHLAGSR